MLSRQVTTMMAKTATTYAIRVHHCSGGWFIEHEPADSLPAALAQVRARWASDPMVTGVVYTGAPPKVGHWQTQESSPSN